MNFLIFRNFSGFFLNYFRFLKIKNDLKNDKKGVNIRAGHVDMTWHLGPRGSATRAPAWRGGDTWVLFIFIIYRFYNIYRSSDYRTTDY